MDWAANYWSLEGSPDGHQSCSIEHWNKRRLLKFWWTCCCTGLFD